MRRAVSVVLALVLALMLVSVGAVVAKAPGTGDRTGDMELVLNFGAFAVPPIEFSDVTWIGTITFGEGEDEVVYGMAFFLTPGKPHPVKPLPVVTHWTEDWAVYELDTFDYGFTGPVLTTFDPGEPVLWGHDSGMTHWKNFTWTGNGHVSGAESPFEEWMGSRTHATGDFGVDFVEGTSWAAGTLRFN